MDDWHSREIADVVRQTDVYARVSPGHKLAIVSALQADGHVVAGDLPHRPPSPGHACAVRRRVRRALHRARGREICRQNMSSGLLSDVRANRMATSSAVRAGNFYERWKGVPR